MIKIVLDSNVYDKLEADLETASLLAQAIREGRVEVIMPREVAQEATPRHGRHNLYSSKLETRNPP